MRPAPREPSKQLNAKSLPATKRRAASGLRVSAHAKLAASRVATTTANRAIIPTPLPRYRRCGNRNRPLTIRIARLCRILVNKSSTRLPDVNHDATANAALDDAAGRLDPPGTPTHTRMSRKLPPSEVPPQPLTRHSPHSHRTHDGADVEKRSPPQDNRRARSRQIHAARQSTGRTPPP